MGSGSGVSPSLRVVQQVAASKGIEPAELEPPLHEILDPDALDTLVRSMTRQPEPSAGAVEFVYQDWRVRVDSAGTVDVTARGQVSDSSPKSADDSRSDRQ